jgi:trans-L-3-hydroxyproline dehydratase
MHANPLAHWQPPAHWQRFTTLECHTGGEPLRIVTSGFPALQGKSVLAMRRECREQYDHLRRALMWEPRGHADMYGCLILPPERANSAFSTLFLHNEGFSTMCGHAIIALARVAVESGMVARTEGVTTLRIDTPAGQITARAWQEANGQWHSSFDNVASFVLQHNTCVQVEGMGQVAYTLAYGGAYYAYVDADALGLELVPDNHRQLIDAGRRIKQAVQQAGPIVHPLESEDGLGEDLGFLYGTIFYGRSPQSGVHSRHVCIFADGELDRSPTGTGVSGRAAMLHALGQLETGASVTIDSILGSRFDVSVQRQVSCGSSSNSSGHITAILPRVAGQAHVTGSNSFWIDPDDPLQQGFLFR